MILVEQDPDSDVEFAVAEQERPLDVLLDNKGIVLYLVGIVRLLFNIRRGSLLLNARFLLSILTRLLLR
jgi:hypothetical protein